MPQVNFAYKLSQYLLYFKGYNPNKYLIILTLYNSTIDSPLYLSINNYVTLLKEARLPYIIEKASLLTATKWSAYTPLDQQRIFEGNIIPRFSSNDDGEEQDLNLFNTNKETNLNLSNSNKESD